MKISIIVPFFNTKISYLEALICQLSSLDSNFFEIIFVNDGSEEKCSSFVLNKCIEHGFIYLANDKNVGVSACRNKGIAKSSGDYLFFVDSDDLLDLSILDESIKYLDGDLLILTSGIFFNDFPITKKQQLNKVSDDDLFDLLLNEKYPGIAMKSACSKFFRRNFIIENDLKFDESLPFYEDYMFMSDVYSLKPKFSIYNNVVYFYRLHEGSSSKKFNKNYIFKYEIFFEKYLEKFSNNEKLIRSLYSATFNSMMIDKVVRSFKKGHYFYSNRIVKSLSIKKSAIYLLENNLLNSAIKKKLASLIIKQHTIRATNYIINHQMLSSLKIKFKRLFKR